MGVSAQTATSDKNVAVHKQPSRIREALTILFASKTAIIGLIIVPGEEKYLEKSLGDEYIKYKRRVRRWF